MGKSPCNTLYVRPVLPGVLDLFFIVCVLLHFKDGIAFSFAILLKPTREHFNVGKHRDICFYLIYENEN